jgi:hypothetical protein
MTILGKKAVVPIVSGVMPLEDSTELDTLYFTNTDKIRFQNGRLRKLKGWNRLFSTNFQTIKGAARNIFSYTNAAGNPISIIGTNTRLYAVINNTFYNITPLVTSTTTIANAFTTEYVTGTYAVTTTIGSPIVTISLFNYLNSGDSIQIGSASNTVNGIPAASFNNTFQVNVINNQIQINTGTNATSSGTATLNFQWATSYLYVNYTNHGYTKGDRIKILAASDVGNILAASINKENYVTNIVDNNTFVIQTNIIASSLVSAGGGASTTIQGQIAAGLVDQSEGFGFGGGNFGAGNFGAQGAFAAPGTYPRIWSMDTYGNTLILTPGDPATTSTDNLYVWLNNDVTVAPVLVSSQVGASNVPLAVKWIYVSHNAVVTLGSAGLLNNYVASNVGSYVNYSPGAATSAFATTIQQAAPFISQASSRDKDLIFTESEVYLAEYVDLPFIWKFKKLFTTDGLIGPKARAEVEDSVFWMGQGDFFVFDGTSVNIIPNNTVKRYVYDNINFAQIAKIVAFANEEYNEVWWFIPFGNSIEPNNYVKYNYKEGVWDIGTLNRTAAEEPLNIHELPWLIESQITQNISAANSLRSYFFSAGTGAIANNPLATVNGTKVITITVQCDCFLEAGDYIQIQGAIDTNGIPAAEINGIKQIQSTSVLLFKSGYGQGGYGLGAYGQGYSTLLNRIVINATATNATSTGSGGGNNIQIGTNIIGITLSAVPEISSGDVITLTGAQNVDGIASSQINGVNIPVRYISNNTIQIQTHSVNTVFSNARVYNAGGAGAVMSFNPPARLFQHEYGFDDYNEFYNPVTDPSYSQFAPMYSYAQTNYSQIENGDDTMLIYSVYPDTKQSVNTVTPPLPPAAPIINLTVNGRLYSQSQVRTLGPYNITPNTTKVDIMLVARQRQYIIESNTLGADYIIGKWMEEVKPSSTR